MESHRDAISTLRGEGWSGREPHSGSIMFLHRGAIGEATTSGVVIFLHDRHQLAASVEESSALTYLRAWVSDSGRGNFMIWLAH